VISAREFLQLWKIWPRVMDSLFFVLGRESTLHVWRRETTQKGRSHMCGADCMESLYRISVHVCGFQWEQSCMYVGFSGDSRVCTRVVVETVVYIRTGSSGQFGRSVQADVNSRTTDVNMPYRWSATDL
jgi:hypothetical protein